MMYLFYNDDYSMTWRIDVWKISRLSRRKQATGKENRIPNLSKMWRNNAAIVLLSEVRALTIRVKLWELDLFCCPISGFETMETHFLKLKSLKTRVPGFSLTILFRAVSSLLEVHPFMVGRKRTFVEVLSSGDLFGLFPHLRLIEQHFIP